MLCIYLSLKPIRYIARTGLGSSIDFFFNQESIMKRTLIATALIAFAATAAYAKQPPKKAPYKKPYTSAKAPKTDDPETAGTKRKSPPARS